MMRCLKSLRSHCVPVHPHRLGLGRPGPGLSLHGADKKKAVPVQPYQAEAEWRPYNLRLGLGPETFKICSRKAGFWLPGPGNVLIFREGSTMSAPSWRAWWGTSLGTLRVSR